MQKMVSIVLLFPCVLSLSFFFGARENRKHMFFFAILALPELFTFSRWFSSHKKRFKNHDGKTGSPANHEMESFGLSWVLPDGTTKACHPTWGCARGLVGRVPLMEPHPFTPDTHPQHHHHQQRYRQATTTIPRRDGDITLKIGEGGLMGDPLMVALFFVAFLPSTIR